MLAHADYSADKSIVMRKIHGCVAHRLTRRRRQASQPKKREWLTYGLAQLGVRDTITLNCNKKCIAYTHTSRSSAIPGVLYNMGSTECRGFPLPHSSVLVVQTREVDPFQPGSPK
jgi:hypothetical protein